MGYLTNGLTFNTLTDASVKRLPHFKNAKGEQAHSNPDGSDWSLTDWMTAVAGEVGEAANIIKKIRRGDFSLEEAKEPLSEELADAVCYIAILAFRADIDLGKAIIRKFNAVSAKVGSQIRINDSGDDWHNEIPKP